MKPVKAIFSTIFEINKEEYEALMNRFDKKLCSNCDRQLYIYKTPDNLFIAIDNSSGEMFTEQFTIKEDAYIWLFGLKAVEPLQQAEKESYWW